MIPGEKLGTSYSTDHQSVRSIGGGCVRIVLEEGKEGEEEEEEEEVEEEEEEDVRSSSSNTQSTNQSCTSRLRHTISTPFYRTITNLYFYANVMYIVYMALLLFIDFHLLPDSNDHQDMNVINHMYTVSALVHLVNALLYYVSWNSSSTSSNRLLKPLDYRLLPEYGNIIAAVLYIYSSLLYSSSSAPSSIDQTSIIIKVEGVAAVIELFCAVGWAAVWYTNSHDSVIIRNSHDDESAPLSPSPSSSRDRVVGDGDACPDNYSTTTTTTTTTNDNNHHEAILIASSKHKGCSRSSEAYCRFRPASLLVCSFDFYAAVATLAGAIAYLVYTTSTDNTSLTYIVGDILYGIGAVGYLLAGLKEDGWGG